MDFVARAGALMDKSHRISGILLVVIVVQLVIIFFSMSNNSANQAEHRRLLRTLPVYVVPGSTADIYRPESSDTLVVAFTDFLTQSLYTFTFESYGGQYDEVKKFFTPEMLRFADPFFSKRIKQSNSLRASELFIPNRQTMKITQETVNGQTLRIATVRGSQQRIINGNVVQIQPVEFVLRFRPTTVSRANPFGLMVLSMRTRELGTGGNG